MTGFRAILFTSDKLEAYGAGNYLKGGLVYADWITTVSGVYANEIKYPFYGEGLDGLMRARSNNLSGIVNGIDYDEYDPETDPMLVHNYSPYNFRTEKVHNKTALQQELGMQVDGGKFTDRSCFKIDRSEGNGSDRLCDGTDLCGRCTVCYSRYR